MLMRNPIETLVKVKVTFASSSTKAHFLRSNVAQFNLLHFASGWKNLSNVHNTYRSVYPIATSFCAIRCVKQKIPKVWVTGTLAN